MQSQKITAPTRSRLTLWAGSATILLVVIGDVLLFDADPGINLFLTALAIALAVMAIAWRRQRYRHGTVGFVAAIALSLPLIEAPSLVGVALAALGLSIAALLAVRLLPDRLDRAPGTILRFLLPAPATLVRDAAALRPSFQQQAGRTAAMWLVAWIIPLGLGVIFVSLFAAANPLIEDALARISLPAALDLLDPLRLIFWLIAAVAIWALLRPKLLRRRRRKLAAPVSSMREPVWLGRAAILRSLIVFNALFAVQTALDLTYLWGGAALPDGMNHAEYAHRGAYPLIATALLAGAFVLAAMRDDGAADQSRTIRSLVYVFIAQNVLLCISAILRLELYVEVYSLTELRLAAGIWMGLVAIGLVLILLRIWLRQTNGWLIATNLLAVVLVLYATAQLDLSAYVARFNVEHSHELTGQGMSIDLDYLDALGPAAIPALDQLIPRLAPETRIWANAMSLRSELVGDLQDKPGDWRSWSWRQQRLADYLTMHEVVSAPSKRHNEQPEVR